MQLLQDSYLNYKLSEFFNNERHRQVDTCYILNIKGKVSHISYCKLEILTTSKIPQINIFPQVSHIGLPYNYSDAIQFCCCIGEGFSDSIALSLTVIKQLLFRKIIWIFLLITDMKKIENTCIRGSWYWSIGFIFS